MKSNLKMFGKMICFPINKIGKYLNLLIKTNSGYSSKTVIMLWGVFMTTMWSGFLMRIIHLSVIYKVEVNWYGITAVIGALATLAGVFIWGKVKGESYEYMNNNLPPVDETKEP